MEASLDPEVLLTRQRTDLLRDLGTAASATQTAQQRSTLGQISDTAANLRSINTSLTPPLNPYRGRNIDIVV